MDKALFTPKNSKFNDKRRVFPEMLRALFAIGAQKEDGSDEKPLSDREKIMQEIEDTLTELRQAKNCFENAKDPEIIEACVYKIKSGEARYSYLLRKAKLLGERTPKISV